MLAAPAIRQHGRWSGRAPSGRNALIDSADVVDVIVTVLGGQAARGGRHVLTGPEGLAWPDVANVLTRVLRRPIAYQGVAVEERRAELERSGLPAWRVELLARSRRDQSRGHLRDPYRHGPTADGARAAHR